MEEIRLVVLNEGEDILSAYLSILQKNLEDRINELQENVSNSYPEFKNKFLGAKDDPFSQNYYDEKKKDILKKLKNYLIDENAVYKNPYLSGKGHIQAFYSGIMLRSYLKQKKLIDSKLTYSAPTESILNGSLKEVLKSYEVVDKTKVVIIPDFIQKREEYEKEKIESYEVLDDGFDPKEIKAQDSDETIVKRFKKGLEKLFLNHKITSEVGIPILIIPGNILDKFFGICLKGEKIGPVKDSSTYDITISFNDSGKFAGVKLNSELQMDEALRKLYDKDLGKVTPPEINNDYNLTLAFMNYLLANFESETKKLFSKKINREELSFVDKEELFLEKIENFNFYSFFNRIKVKKNQQIDTVSTYPTDNSNEATPDKSTNNNLPVENLEALATSPLNHQEEKTYLSSTKTTKKQVKFAQ